MNSEDKTQERQAIVDAVSAHIAQVMVDLHQRHGLPWELIAVGAHAQAVVAMTTIMGGPMTAQCCERAANRVRDLPSAAANALAFMPPEGRA